MGWATARASNVPTHALASSGVNTMWLRRLTTVRSYSFGSMSCAGHRPRRMLRGRWILGWAGLCWGI